MKNISDLKVTPMLLSSGNWSETTSWERHISPILPPQELCSAAFCVAIKDEKIVLMRAERGWGILGGHIEQGESVIDALYREALEEGGFRIIDHTLLGHRKIIATAPNKHPVDGCEYPFPISYIPFYIATSSVPLVAATGQEVLETNMFTIDQVSRMNLDDWPIIKAAWDVLRS